MPKIENKDILFIINPNSGKKSAEKLVKKINTIDSNIAVVLTQNLTELDQTFKQNIDKYKVFIVVGGDGTVNEATKYLLHRNDKIFGVFPAGSGNGFSNELGFKKNLESLIADAKKGESLLVDVLLVNNKNCINVAGLGFDSFVAHEFHKSKGRGLKNYILSTIKSVFVFKPFDANITIGSQKIQGKFQMISIANTRQFGNNALVSPQSKPNDGVFEIVLVKPFPIYLYPSFIVKMFRGNLKESKYITYLQVKENAEITSAFKQYHVDGEPKVFEGSLKIKMLENKIRVLQTSQNPLTN